MQRGNQNKYIENYKNLVKMQNQQNNPQTVKNPVNQSKVMCNLFTEQTTINNGKINLYFISRFECNALKIGEKCDSNSPNNRITILKKCLFEQKLLIPKFIHKKEPKKLVVSNKLKETLSEICEKQKKLVQEKRL